MGYVGYIGFHGPDLHFTLAIEDDYDGITCIDGQPTVSFDFKKLNPKNFGGGNFKMITTNLYHNTLPKNVVIYVEITPPINMPRSVFARRLIDRALNFGSYTSVYSVPKRLYGENMLDREYNSSSYLAGLLNAVMGFVPKLETPGYSTPGWENPMPSHFFKGEAIK